MTEVSLRERSKAKRRDAIQRAALRLFTERGYEATTVVQIAALAEVSPRTVSLHFPTKADLALAPVDEAVRRLTALLEERDPQTSVAEVLDTWLRLEAGLRDPELAALTEAMFRANPALRAMRTGEIDRAVEVGTVALSAELGVSPDHHAVRLVRGAVAGMLAEYAGAVEEHDGEQVRDTLLAVLRAALRAAAPEAASSGLG